MSRKLFFILTLCFACMHNVRAADYYFRDGDPADHFWTTPGNWSTGAVPVEPIGAVWADANAVTCELNTDVTMSSHLFWPRGGTAAAQATFIIQPETSLTSTGYMILGYGAKDDGTLIMNGGTATFSGAYSGIGWKGKGTLIMNDGVLTTKELRMVHQAGGPGGSLLHMLGGTINETARFSVSLQSSPLGSTALIEGGQLNAPLILVARSGAGTLVVSGSGRVEAGELKVGGDGTAIGQGLVEVGAYLSCGQVILGNSASSTAEMTLMNGAETYVSGDVHVGYHANATALLTVNGGYMKIEGNLVLSKPQSVQLNGGIVIASGITAADGSTGILLNINGGRLASTGDKRSMFNSLINAGCLAYNGQTGVLRSFYDPALNMTFVQYDPSAAVMAINESPESGAVLPLNQYNAVVLSWTAGQGAVSHNVYCGTSFEAVASSSPSAFVGNFAAAVSQTALANCSISEYFWKVDEVQSDSSVVAGDVWSFSFADYYVIDNMDLYGTDPNDPNIVDTWIGISAELSAESRFKYQGEYSLRFLTTGDNAMATWNEPGTISLQELNAMGIAALKLWFVGGDEHNPGVGNLPQTLKLRLTDVHGSCSEVAYPDPATIVRGDKWFEWVVMLDEFTGIDMNAIDSISLGLQYDNTLVLVDDIRLIGWTCDAPPEGDINGDCVVNIHDVFDMAGLWLTKQQSIGYDSAFSF